MVKAPQKINNLVIFDFETSGLDKVNGLHSQTRSITEFAGLAINAVTLEEIIRYDNIVKPYDPKHIWDVEAENITGLSKKVCEEQGIPLRQLVDDICELLTLANPHGTKTAKPQLVAHNGAFDKPFLQDIFARAKVDLSKYVDGAKDHFGNFQPVVHNSMDFAKWIWAEITDTSTKFTLTACCERAGIDLVDAHRAMNDVIPLAEFVRYSIAKLRSMEAAASSPGSTSAPKASHRVNFQW